MKTLAAFSTPAQAHIALSRLESAGIRASTRDEMTVAMDWLISNAIGGVKIEVEDEDYEDARAILDMPVPEPGLIRCPKCGSSDGSVRELSASALACILLRLPLPMHRVVVDCRACGNEFEVPSAGKADPGLSGGPTGGGVSPGN